MSHCHVDVKAADETWEEAGPRSVRWWLCVHVCKCVCVRAHECACVCLCACVFRCACQVLCGLGVSLWENILLCFLFFCWVFFTQYRLYYSLRRQPELQAESRALPAWLAKPNRFQWNSPITEWNSLYFSPSRESTPQEEVKSILLWLLVPFSEKLGMQRNTYLLLHPSPDYFASLRTSYLLLQISELQLGIIYMLRLNECVIAVGFYCFLTFYSVFLLFISWICYFVSWRWKRHCPASPLNLFPAGVFLTGSCQSTHVSYMLMCQKNEGRSHSCEWSMDDLGVGAGSVELPGVWKARWRWPLTSARSLCSLSHPGGPKIGRPARPPEVAFAWGTSGGDLVHHWGHLAELRRRKNWKEMVFKVYPCHLFTSSPLMGNSSKLRTDQKRRIVAKRRYFSVNFAAVRQDGNTCGAAPRCIATGCLRWLCSSSEKKARDAAARLPHLTSESLCTLFSFCKTHVRMKNGEAVKILL